MADNKLLKDLRWRLDDIRDMLMKEGFDGQRIYGCDEWSTPTVNLATAIGVIDKALASPPVAVQEEGDAWQPIETAPVGVEMFLAAAIDYPVSKARKYTTDPWVVWQSATGVFIRWPHQFAPTHWAPIPAMKGDQP